MIPDLAPASRLDTPLKRWFPVTKENLIVLLILIVAIISRFYDLGARTMSHDEINHVVPSYSLYTGRGYIFDPMSHGPLQFHLITLAYGLFGDNDFSTRIPAAIFGIATIAIGLILFRRYLGRAGAIAAGLLLLISPYLLFYGRYARNEIFIVLWSMLLIYSVLRYLERGETWTLFLFILANAFHFTDKATSYMFAGGIFVFLFFYFIDHVSRRQWTSNRLRILFLLAIGLAIILAVSAVVVYLELKPETDSSAIVASVLPQADEPGQVAEKSFPTGILALIVLLALGGVCAGVWAGITLVRGLGWAVLRSVRALNLLILIGTMILPMVAAIPIMLLGYTVIEYTTMGYVRIAISVIVLGGMGAALGVWWFGKRWFLFAAVFFLPTIVLFTTFFTEPRMIGSGFVGLFTYWYGQHFEGRGGQPYFYYALIQIPVYEFLPAIGTLVAVVIAGIKRLWRSAPGQPFQPPSDEEGAEQPVPIVSLTVFWSIFMLVIFSFAGEKMPWITTHIALPMILTTAWGIGWLVEARPWTRVAWWDWRMAIRVLTLTSLGLLSILTLRTAFRAAYINYDYPLEYMVYAHAAPDPKSLFKQIEEISYRTNGSTDIVVAYDNDVRYPFWWYLRRYPNKIDFDTTPTREVRNALIIAANTSKTSQLAPVVQENFIQIQGMRLWWQNQDYWSLKWDNIEREQRVALAGEYAERGEVVPPMTILGYLEYAWPHIKPFFTDPAVRSAVWQIWFNRDYTEWGILRNNPPAYTLTNWGVAERMTTYYRKDLDVQLWPFGAEAQTLTIPVDPYEALIAPVFPDKMLGVPGTDSGTFLYPRQIAVALDGSMYVADSLNHRIVHISQDGEVLDEWGRYANLLVGEDAPGGTFNEPWGVAVAPDGSVYVADTWNFRIQKFTADGEYLLSWSTYDEGAGPISFYGPRGLAVDSQGHVYVADTGNKAIIVFDELGNFIAKIGQPGLGFGQLDEPVAVVVDGSGKVYVTDTWNQRVQVFVPDPSGEYYFPLIEWPVSGWYGQSLENKPFLTLGQDGDVFITDPEMCRIIQFSAVGDPLKVWDGCLSGAFKIPSGIVSDGLGGIWISDVANGTLVHFIPSIP